MAGEAPLVFYAVAWTLQGLYPADPADRDLARDRTLRAVGTTALVVGALVAAQGTTEVIPRVPPIAAGAAAAVLVAMNYRVLDRRAEAAPAWLAVRALGPALAGYAVILFAVRLMQWPYPWAWWSLSFAAVFAAHAWATERRRAEARRAPMTGRALQIGRRLGCRYVIERHLGDQDPARAAVARDRRTGDRVVLKATPRHGPEGILHEKELAAIARIDHPNIVRLLDHRVRDGLVVLVLPYAEGGDLAARLRRGALSDADWARLADGLLAGLAAAHEANILHRDVKPANILLTSDGGAMVADFNMARIADSDRTIAVDPRTMTPVGTIRYMAPEVARGGEASVASDLWSAAATLYEARTGRCVMPVDGNETVPETLRRVAAFDAASLPINDAVDEVLATTLSPMPGARPASASALADAIRTARASLAAPPVAAQTST